MENQELSTKNHERSTRSSDEVLVRVEGVSKKFCRDLKKSLWYGVCDISSELNPFGRKSHVPGLGVPGASLNQEPRTKNQEQAEGLRPDEFYAVRDVSFELRRGECLGLIGRNGAGKTTLLKMLNGLIKPDSGRIEMRGRIGALIALGAGFNPILTGRENVYVNGSVLGLTKKDVDAKFDEIVDFAEIGEFIDTPVRNYSSGMQVRLGFAVASTLDPDVLLLDEVLAVGDASFRAKCYNRVGSLLDQAAVIFVSHNMEQIARVCKKIIYLTKGKGELYGHVSSGIRKYEEGNQESNDSSNTFIKCSGAILEGKCVWREARIKFGQSLHFSLTADLTEPLSNVSFRHAFYDITGTAVAEWTNFYAGLKIDLHRGKNTLEHEIGPIRLKPGLYYVSTFITESNGVSVAFWQHKVDKILIDGPTFGICNYQL